jgi:hypothetical protein
MLPEKNRKSLKSISLQSRKFEHCFEYMETLFQECDKFPALLRIDARCEGMARMRSFRRDSIRYGAFAMGVEICITSETHDFFRVWTLARFEGGEAWPKWRKTRCVKTRDLNRWQVLTPAVEDDKNDALPQEITQEQIRQIRVPRIKKLLHKLLCACTE